MLSSLFRVCEPAERKSKGQSRRKGGQEKAIRRHGRYGLRSCSTYWYQMTCSNPRTARQTPVDMSWRTLSLRPLPAMRPDELRSHLIRRKGGETPCIQSAQEKRQKSSLGRSTV